MIAVNEWSQVFSPTSLNQILGLGQETAFCSSSPVVRLVLKESLSLVRRDGFVAGAGSNAVLRS